RGAEGGSRAADGLEADVEGGDDRKATTGARRGRIEKGSDGCTAEGRRESAPAAGGPQGGPPPLPRVQLARRMQPPAVPLQARAHTGLHRGPDGLGVPSGRVPAPPRRSVRHRRLRRRSVRGGAPAGPTADGSSAAKVGASRRCVFHFLPPPSHRVLPGRRPVPGRP
ncbi:hypothetical protein DIPPA_32644, partial [Diplonema papillatum]